MVTVITTMVIAMKAPPINKIEKEGDTPLFQI